MVVKIKHFSIRKFISRYPALCGFTLFWIGVAVSYALYAHSQALVNYHNLIHGCEANNPVREADVILGKKVDSPHAVHLITSTPDTDRETGERHCDQAFNEPPVFP